MAMIKEEVVSCLKKWTEFENIEVRDAGESYKVVVSNGDKRITVTSPYEVGEFFVDFEAEGRAIYTDWYEIMNDPLDEFMAYTKSVVDNFLHHEVRVKKAGFLFFKTEQLQYLKDGSWCNVL